MSLLASGTLPRTGGFFPSCVLPPGLKVTRVAPGDSLSASLANPGSVSVHALRKLPCLAPCAIQQSRRRRHGDRRSGMRVFALFEKFTEGAIKAVMMGQQEARSTNCSEVCSEHVLLGVMAQNPDNFYSTDVSLDRARESINALFGRRRSRENPKMTQDMPFSRNAKKVFEQASMESRRMGMRYILPEHIVIALVSSGDIGAKKVIDRLGINADKLKDEAVKRMRGEREGETATAPKRKAAAAGASSSSSEREGKSALEEFCRDLCAEARAQRTDPVIGRAQEVHRVIQILGRRTKNNPILLGEPGVGKTAIAEGLASAIVQGVSTDGTPLPEWLLNKRVMQLDVGLLIAGAKERGELELRVTKLLAEVKEGKDVILMIDEVHTLVGAGAVGRGGGGGLDISNLVKPALARGDLQCIGATTLDEHRKYIEKDTALERRFQPVMVGEPSADDTLLILEGLKDRYERHHHCLYDHAALEACARLSERYIADRFLPDKAIDIMDEAGSRVRIAAYFARERSGQAGSMDPIAWDELQQVIEAKDEAIKDGLFEEAILLRSRENELKAKLAGPAEEAPLIPVVGPEDVESIVAAWTGVPVERMSEEDSSRLMRLGDVLKERVIGQDDAVEAIARAMRRARSGLKDPARPIATLLFSGPTGVGKTELTKALSEYYFGSPDAMIRLDMSEYMERHTVAKLIGAPPGYVGYGDGGKLTEAVRRRPFSVVLLDEIEKAHPDVFNILLQVIEDGRLTDSQGRTVSFKNCLLIMTSNIGSNVIAKGGGSLGFVLDGGEEDSNYTRIRTLVMEELKGYFRPELLNRLDEVVVFRQLGVQEVRTIADLLLQETASRMLESRGIHLQVTAAMMEQLCEEGYDQAYGARPLRRAITRMVEDVLSDAVLHGRLQSGDVAVIDVQDKQAVVMSQQDWEQARPTIVYSNVA